MSETLPVAEAAVIQPGDTLILRVNATGGRVLTPDLAARVRARCLELLPQLADAQVVQCDGLAVFRPENNTQPEDSCQPPSKTRKARTRAAEAPPRTAPAKAAAPTR